MTGKEKSIIEKILIEVGLEPLNAREAEEHDTKLETS